MKIFKNSKNSFISTSVNRSDQISDKLHKISKIRPFVLGMKRNSILNTKKQIYWTLRTIPIFTLTDWKYKFWKYTGYHEMPQKTFERGFSHVILKCPKIEEFHFRFLFCFKIDHVLIFWSAPLFYVRSFLNASFFLSDSENHDTPCIRFKSTGQTIEILALNDVWSSAKKRFLRGFWYLASFSLISNRTILLVRGFTIFIKFFFGT